jgi:hypothetical protein
MVIIDIKGLPFLSKNAPFACADTPTHPNIGIEHSPFFIRSPFSLSPGLQHSIHPSVFTTKGFAPLRDDYELC